MTTMTTRDYEALVIFKTVGGEQDLARHASQLEEHIKRVGGRIDSSQNLGRRRLAFRISRQSEGYYQVLRFHAPTEQIGELERLFRLNDTIVRFMILNAEELPTAAQVAAQPVAAARS